MAVLRALSPGGVIQLSVERRARGDVDSLFSCLQDPEYDCWLCSPPVPKIGCRSDRDVSCLAGSCLAASSRAASCGSTPPASDLLLTCFREQISLELHRIRRDDCLRCPLVFGPAAIGQATRVTLSDGLAFPARQPALERSQSPRGMRQGRALGRRARGLKGPPPSASASLPST